MDPVWSGVLRVALALLFARAAIHKGRDFARFVGVLADYRLLPRRTVRITAAGLVAIEGLVAFGFLLPPLGALAAATGASLLAAYTLAIGINLLRGRREIDCGCGGEPGQRLHAALLVRNLALIGASLAAGVPAVARAWTGVDTLGLAAGVAITALVWTTLERLASYPPARPVAARIDSKAASPSSPRFSIGGSDHA